MAIVMVTSALMTNVAVRFEDDEYLLPGRRIFQAHRWLAISNELGRGLAHRARFDAGGNASEHGERLSELARGHTDFFHSRAIWDIIEGCQIDEG